MTKITIDYGPEWEKIEFEVDDATWTWERPTETLFNLDGSVMKIIPGKMAEITIRAFRKNMDPEDPF